MERTTVTVYQDSDVLSLGPEATQEDLDGFCANLAAHLADKFGVAVEVEQRLGGELGGRVCPENDEIDEYVRELERGDGWLSFLPAVVDYRSSRTGR